MERKKQKVILTYLLFAFTQAAGTVSDIERIIDRPFDPAIQLGKWDLIEAVNKINISTMDANQRHVLLENFYERSCKRLSEHYLSPFRVTLSHLYKGALVCSLFFTGKYIVQAAMPGRFGILGQTIDGFFASASLLALLYSGKKVFDFQSEQRKLDAAQRRVDYFKNQIDLYKNP